MCYSNILQNPVYFCRVRYTQRHGLQSLVALPPLHSAQLFLPLAQSDLEAKNELYRLLN